MFSATRAVLLAALFLAPGHRLGAELAAKVGPEKIDSTELEAKIAFEERNAGRKLEPHERQGVLQSLINQRLLVAKAKDEGYPKKDEFKRTVQDYERQLLAGAVYEREVASKSAVSEAECRSFFDANPKLFDLREVSQILVQAPSADKVDAARARAQRLMSRAAAAPKSFAALAKAESDDAASRERGGDLGKLRPGMMLPELEKAVWEAKPGAVIGPVQTRFGFHVLRVRSTHKQGWEEAKEGLAKELAAARAAQLQQKFLEELAKKYKITVNGAK